MERPSHMHFTHQSFSRRMPVIGLALGLPIAMFWAFDLGLGGSAINIFKDGPLVVDYIPPVKPKTPPPKEPQMKTVETVAPIEPTFNTEREPRGGDVTVSPAPNTGGGTAPLGPTRAPVSIMATHTEPPYSALARRMSWEGTVVLRLTVLTDGRVGAAEVVTSSGRAELDQTAQSWIVRHWTYRPALENGTPAEARVLASVKFSLTD